MKVPVLSIAVLLSLLALHSAQGAALGDSWGMTTESNYAEESKSPDTQFLNVDRWRSAFQSKEFLNWHAFFEALKEKLPFLNWEVLPKLKGMRSIIPDGQ
ncbi:keratinocyte differentiation-associated protein [Monodelphis domestica]|uniref:keratinocyte differentiation-associated protein n=1 Tax=Monodelphis domestica TaxID=13616 RepID=UPI0024E263F2|nr:keratinocyte differentiation-associated protein [Monodelphis domestica]